MQWENKFKIRDCQRHLQPRGSSEELQHSNYLQIQKYFTLVLLVTNIMSECLFTEQCSAHHCSALVHVFVWGVQLLNYCLSACVPMFECMFASGDSCWCTSASANCQCANVPVYQCTSVPLVTVIDAPYLFSPPLATLPLGFKPARIFKSAPISNTNTHKNIQIQKT